MFLALNLKAGIYGVLRGSLAVVRTGARSRPEDEFPPNLIDEEWTKASAYYSILVCISIRRSFSAHNSWGNVVSSAAVCTLFPHGVARVFRLDETCLSEARTVN